MTHLKCRDNRFDKVVAGNVIHLLETMGADFKRQYDLQSYQRFFEDAGYENAAYFVVEGRMPCAVAVITKEPRVF